LHSDRIAKAIIKHKESGVMQRRTSSWYRLGAMGRLAVLSLVVMLAGGFAAPAMAQDEEPDIDTYVSDAYDFSIEWDQNLWNSSSSVSFGDQESLTISNGVTTVSFNLSPASGQSVAECTDLAVSDIESNPDFLEPKAVNNLEVPGPLGSDDGVTLVYRELLEGRTSPVEIGAYVTCQPVTIDGMLLIQVETRLGIWGEEMEIVEALLETMDAEV